MVLVESSELQLTAAPNLLVEAFKHPISDKMKLTKSKLKSTITAIYCITDNKVVLMTKVWMFNFKSLWQYVTLGTTSYVHSDDCDQTEVFLEIICIV